MSADYGTSRHR